MFAVNPCFPSTALCTFQSQPHCSPVSHRRSSSLQAVVMFEFPFLSLGLGERWTKFDCQQKHQWCHCSNVSNLNRPSKKETWVDSSMMVPCFNIFQPFLIGLGSISETSQCRPTWLKFWDEIDSWRFLQVALIVIKHAYPASWGHTIFGAWIPLPRHLGILRSGD